jgi:alpha-N-arabinofuranosidase
MADMCGTRWQNNAIKMPVPSGKSFMMPVAMIMHLYRKYTGSHAISVVGSPDGLDVTASRSGNHVYLHVVNTSRTGTVTADFNIAGMEVKTGKVHSIALDPAYEVFEHKPEITLPKSADLPAGRSWTFPAASVSAVVLNVKAL